MPKPRKRKQARSPTLPSASEYNGEEVEAVQSESYSQSEMQSQSQSEMQSQSQAQSEMQSQS